MAELKDLIQRLQQQTETLRQERAAAKDSSASTKLVAEQEARVRCVRQTACARVGIAHCWVLWGHHVLQISFLVGRLEQSQMEMEALDSMSRSKIEELQSKLTETRTRLRVANDRCRTLQQQVDDMRRAGNAAAAAATAGAGGGVASGSRDRHVDLLSHGRGRATRARQPSPALSPTRVAGRVVGVSPPSQLASGGAASPSPGRVHASPADSATTGSGGGRQVPGDVQRVQRARAEFYEAVASLKAGKIRDLEQRIATAESSLLRASGSSSRRRYGSSASPASGPATSPDPAGRFMRGSATSSSRYGHGSTMPSPSSGRAIRSFR